MPRVACGDHKKKKRFSKNGRRSEALLVTLSSMASCLPWDPHFDIVAATGLCSCGSVLRPDIGAERDEHDHDHHASYR